MPRRTTSGPSHEPRSRVASEKPAGPRRYLLGGLATLLVARPFLPSETAAEGEGLAFVMLTLALVALWTLLGLHRGSLSVRVGAPEWAFLVLLAWHALSVAIAGPRNSPRLATNMLWEWVGMGALFFLIRQLAPSPREIRAIVAVMIALAVVLSAFAFYQYFISNEETSREFWQDPQRALREAGLRLPDDPAYRRLLEQRVQDTEPTATFALTNSFAGFLIPWIAFTLALAWRSAANLPWRAIAKTPEVWLWIPLVASLVLTKSRGGYVAIAIGAAAIPLLSGRVRWRGKAKFLAAALVVVALVVAIAAFTGGLDRGLLTEAMKSLGYRGQYWRASLAMIAERPWFGCAPGNFQDYYSQVKFADASELVADPHNMLFEVAATAGVPALVALLAIGITWAWERWRSKDDPAEATRDESRSLGKRTPAPETGPDAWRSIFVGGGLGVGLAWVVGQSFSSVPPADELAVSALAIGAAVVFGLRRWIESGELPPAALPLGAVLLALHLMAQGGIGFPAVAECLWLALALDSGKRAEWRISRLATALTALSTIVLMGACLMTAYLPVANLRNSMLAAEKALSDERRRPDDKRVERALEAARNADPWSEDAWLYSSRWAYAHWESDPNEENRSRFEAWHAEARKRRPLRAAIWLEAGSDYLRAAKAKPQGDFAGKAVEAFARAVELYPNSASAHADASEALNLAGDPVRAREEAQVARELDRATPHLDQKLSDSRREFVKKLLDGE